MKKWLLHIVLFFCIAQQSYAQDNGVVAFDVPSRNSLKFNKYTINPTFSFVREQNKYITFYNKRQWVQFDDAPLNYLASYAGRFRENMGLGVGLFQQDYGVLTTFGGILNFAYNAALNTESNLTFGLNLGFYKSGINEGSVNTNFLDPSLENIPSNSIITINPGINYGTTFIDLGLSVKNAVSYNLLTSQMIQNNPEQSIQGHLMYTGYLSSRGFFDEGKFTGLLRSEFKKNQTVVSGLVMLNVPKGIWAQAGYNSLYGVSGGLGLNITTQLAVEYNYEKAIGDLLTFGNSHEITLAYKFKNKQRYSYSGDDDEQALINTNTKKKVLAKNSTAPKLSIEERRLAKAEAQARIKARREAAAAKAEARKVAAQQRQAKAEQENIAKIATEVAKSKASEDTQALKEAEVKVEANKNNEAEKIKQEEVAKIEALKKAEAEKQKIEAAAKLKAAEAAQLELEKEAQAKADQENRIKLQEEAKAEAQNKADEERLKLEETAKLKVEIEAKTKAEEAQAKIETQVEIEAQKKAEGQAVENKQISDTAAIKKTQPKAAPNAIKDETIQMIELDGVLVPVPTNQNTRYLNDLTKLTANSKIEQQKLLLKLSETVDSRNQDLKDLKEENDLSERGIYKAPKPFKSVSAENAKLESLKQEVDNVIKSQNNQIAQLENLYNERLKTVNDKNDAANIFYSKTIQDLKTEQRKAIQTKQNLLSNLQAINEATEIERKRRIKRAVYDNEEDRYLKDRAALKQIKQFTPLASEPLTAADFDSGEQQGTSIQIVKEVKHVESGYYVVVAVHSDVLKRDEFLRKAVAAGQTNIDFFFDVSSNKYYIHYQKFNDIDSAKNAMKLKGTKPYNNNMAMVKVEN
ncbi:PorP/SprF family type IX secretion system membrane protein [Gelatiniphilus marinus]|uniref:PorP/SprF family type IX secretion system membrane protein n=1 Tax=Gelatiniphilus marinus TaxID=1759464 RepID=A0ABW5JP31_9FLAO